MYKESSVLTDNLYYKYLCARCALVYYLGNVLVE